MSELLVVVAASLVVILITTWIGVIQTLIRVERIEKLLIELENRGKA